MAIYYVKNGGNDGLDGLSDANAWASLGKVTGAGLGGGDTVLFKRGSRWRETLHSFQTGASAGSRLTFGAYGTGEKPIIDGSDIHTGWTAETNGGSTGNGENFTDGTGTRPIAWWLMAQTSGNRTSSADASNALVPSASAPTRGTGPHGLFSSEFVKASSQQFDIPEAGMSTTFPGYSTLANGSLTVGGWVRVDSETGSDAGIWGKDTNHQLIIEGSVVIFRIFSSGNATVAVSGEGSTYSPGVWRHYVCRYTQATGEMVLFVNGVKKTPQTIATRNVFTGPFTVGNATFKSNFDGGVAELFVSNSALTDAQIASIHTNGLDGARVTSGPTLYYKALGAKPGAVFSDGTPLQWVQSKGDVTVGKEWWDSTNSRQYIRLSGDDNPSSHTIEVATRVYPMRLQGSNYWTVEDLWVRGALKANIFADTNNNCIVRRCTLSHATENGIHVYTHTDISTYGFEISDNICYLNGACGITVAGNFAASMAGIRIQRNETYQNCWQPVTKENAQFAYTGGIRPIGREINDCIVEDNHVHDEGNDGDLSHGEGIWLDTVGLNCIVRRNLIERTTSWGVQIEDCNAVDVHSNLIVGTLYYPGIAIIRNCDNNRVFNNTIVNCNGGFNPSNGGGSHFSGNQFFNNIVNITTGPIIRGDNGVSTAANVSFNKNVFGPARTNYIEWNGNYSTIASWEGALGASSNSIQTNPTFVNAAAGNYRLEAGSTGISAGAAIPGGTLDYAKTSFIAATPTIGAFEFTTVSTFQVSGTPVAQKPAITATATQTFSARSLTATIQAKKPTIASTVNNQVYIAEFTNEFSYEFTVEDTTERYVSAAIQALKPTISASATQTFPPRSLTGTVTAKKPTIAASASLVFATRTATGTLVAPRPIAAATMSHSFIARFITATIQARKPTFGATIGQVFQARTVTGTVTAKNPTIAATAARGVPAPPARTVTAALGTTRPAIRVTINSARIVPHARAPSWRTVNAGNGTMAGVWQAPLDPNALLDYTVDWADEMSLGDTILTSVLALDPQAAAAGLAIHAESHDTNSVTAWLKIDPLFQSSPGWDGGGETHAISCKVSTIAGRIHDRTFSLTVRTT